MGILKYYKRVHIFLEMSNFLPTTSRKNEDHHSATCDTRNKPFKYDEIQKEINDVLTEVMHNEVDKTKRNYHTMTDEDWIDLLESLETRDDRRHKARDK